MDRRTFLHLAAAAALAVEWMPVAVRGANAKSRVAHVADPAFRTSHALATDQIKRMLDRALSLLTEIDEPQDAWRSLFSPKDVVGLKINCLAGRGLSTTPELVDAIALSLREIGIDSKNIIVWDRTGRDLASAGFAAGTQTPLYRCAGTDEIGFDGTLYEHNSIGSLASSILTRLCSAIINVPVLKDHGITGVSLSMKNYYGAIHNPNKYHPNGGNPFIADLNSMPIIRDKERLIVCDCLRGQYNGGPASDPRWRWPEGALMAARDPVALDAIGLDMIERKRGEHGLPSLEESKRFPAYIATAGTVNKLGNADRGAIDLIVDEV